MNTEMLLAFAKGYYEGRTTGDSEKNPYENGLERTYYFMGYEAGVGDYIREDEEYLSSNANILLKNLVTATREHDKALAQVTSGCDLEIKRACTHAYEKKKTALYEAENFLTC